MNRSKTTEFLSKLTEQKLNSINSYWSREVCFDFGTSDVRRIDFMQFIPMNQLCIDGIEKGVFKGYEVKSCKQDYKSGFGQNYICEYNYIVMTMQTYKDLLKYNNEGKNELEKLPHCVGILIACPKDPTKTDKDILLSEFENPTPIPENYDTYGWKLITFASAIKTYRKKSILEMLFCLMRSKK